MKKPKIKYADEEQSRLFIEKAKEIGADKKKTDSDVVMGKLAKTPPDPRKKKPSK